MRRRILWLVTFLFFALLFSVNQQVVAAPYYEGKRITIVVGFGPGGGYDRIARLLAKYLPNYIPGKPTVICENMEGAASIIAANYLFNIAKPDGLTFGALNKGIPYAQMLKVEGVKFDLAKFAWIGSAATEATVLTIRSDLSYKTFDDLRKAKSQIMIGCTGPAENSYQFCTFLREFLGVNLKLIIYPSSPDVMLALERKEVDARAGSYSSFKPFIERGLVHPVIRGRVAEPGIENLPVAEDLIADPKGKAFMALLSGPERVGRPYVAPPKTPPDLMNILRDAFDKTAKDPGLKEEAKKAKLEIDYIPADECLKEVNNILNQPESIIKEFSSYVKY